MFFWHKPDLDWKSCVARHREEERRKQRRIQRRKRILRSIFHRNLLWGAACLALAIFVSSKASNSTTQYILPTGLLLSLWLSGVPVRSRFFLGGAILAVTFFMIFHGLATHADYGIYPLIGLPVAGVVMGIMSPNVPGKNGEYDWVPGDPFSDPFYSIGDPCHDWGASMFDEDWDKW